MRFYHEAKTNPQIDFLGVKNYSDTPITMVRCLAVEDAKALKADMILMLDSDNIPDGYLGHYSSVKPFFPTAFEFAYVRLQWMSLAWNMGARCRIFLSGLTRRAISRMAGSGFLS
jgi:hypothetical protein